MICFQNQMTCYQSHFGAVALPWSSSDENGCENSLNWTAGHWLHSRALRGLIFAIADCFPLKCRPSKSHSDIPIWLSFSLTTLNKGSCNLENATSCSGINPSLFMILERFEASLMIQKRHANVRSLTYTACASNCPAASASPTTVPTYRR